MACPDWRNGSQGHGKHVAVMPTEGLAEGNHRAAAPNVRKTASTAPATPAAFQDMVYTKRRAPTGVLLLIK